VPRRFLHGGDLFGRGRRRSLGLDDRLGLRIEVDIGRQPAPDAGRET
jgi:hypothetical protein